MQDEQETFPLHPEGLGGAGARRPAATEPVGAGGSGPAAGEVLGRYFLLHELGRGGMGVVYAAYDPELDRKVALKLLHPGRRPGGHAGHAVGQARLLREAQALARLAHPNVIHVYDAGTAGDRVFVAMELVEGEALDEWLEAEPRPWRRVVEVFLAAGRGLAAAHAAGLVHRDFKPANVLLGRDGRVRVVDFGIARPAGDEGAGSPAEGSGGRLSTPLTRAGVVVGTLRYMAPEALRGLPLDARADQYSFCVSLYEALHGDVPWEADDPESRLRAVETVPVPEPPAAGRVPAWLRRIVLRGLAPDPEQRYPSMDALLAELGHDRAAVLRRRALAAGVVLLAGAAGLAAWQGNVRQARLCTGAADRLAGVWDAGRKASVRRAFLASGRPYAADAWRGVERALDAYAAAWTAQRTEACRATRVQGEQSPELLDLRMQCLDHRLGEMRALTALFAAGGPGVVEKAVQASQGLPGLDECADAAGLLAPVRPPSDATGRRRLGEVEGKIARAKTLWLTGRYGDGLPVAAAATAGAARLGYAPAEAEALRVRAQLEEAAGQAEAAEATLFQSLAAAERGRHDELASRAWIQLVFVSGYRERKLDEARRWAELARASLARIGGEAGNPELAADLQSHLGTVLDQAGDHAAGLDLQQRALALYQRTLPPDHPSVGRTLNRLGNAYLQMKRYDEARAAYRRSLELVRRTLGPHHPNVATRLDNLALIEEAVGHWEKSLALQREALEISERSLGPMHPELASSHSNLAGLLLSMDRPEEALAEARKAVAVDEANPATGPADRGASLIALTDSLFHLRRYREALAVSDQANALLVASVGADHPWTAHNLSTRGQILYFEKRPAEAVAPLRRAAAGLQAGGGDVWDTAWTRFTLARALWDSGGDRREALDLARQARRGLEGTSRAKSIPVIDRWLAGKAPA